MTRGACGKKKKKVVTGSGERKKGTGGGDVQKPPYISSGRLKGSRSIMLRATLEKMRMVAKNRNGR